MEFNAFGSGSIVLLVLLIFMAWLGFFAALWTAIIAFMSAFGGWKRLGRRFADSTRREGGTVYRGMTGMVGMSSYKRAVIVTVLPDGIGLCVWKIFWLGHPPLFIPWSEIHNARFATFVFKQYVAFDVGMPVIAKVRLPFRIFADAPVAVE